MLIIDPGNSYIKATDGKRETLTPSIIGEAQEVFTDKKLWQVDGNFIGEDAATYAKFIDYSLRELKSEQRTLSTLVKFILCQYPEEREVVFTLPFSNFHSEKNKMIDQFSIPQAIKYKIGPKEDQRLYIPRFVNALPQGFCAMMDYLLDDNGEVKDKKLLSKTVLGIDAGFGNMNLILLVQGKVVQNLSFSTLNGMHLLYNQVANRTYRNVYEIDHWDSADLLAPLYPSLARVAQTDVETRYRLSDIGLFLILGGAGNAIFNYLPWSNKELHGDQFGNVRGAWKVAKKLWGIKSGLSEAIAN